MSTRASLLARLVFLGAGCLLGCGYSEDALEQKYQEGLDEGRQAGYAQGHDARTAESLIEVMGCIREKKDALQQVLACNSLNQQLLLQVGQLLAENRKLRLDRASCIPLDALPKSWRRSP